MNPFVSDRHLPGEPSWAPFHREILENLALAARSMDYGSGFSGPGRVIQIRSALAGMGKSHLLGRLLEALREEFEVLHLDLRPENLAEWERGWTKGIRIAAEGRRRRLLVLDHLDGFHGDPGAGMRIARMIEEYVETLPRSVVLLCVNEDVWHSVFASRLPGALLDLLTWDLQELPAATVEEAEGLVIHRMQRAGLEEHDILRFLGGFDLVGLDAEAGGQGLGPRALFRKARRQWDIFAARENGRARSSAECTVNGSEGLAPACPVQAYPVADQARKHLHAVADALRHQAGPRTGTGPVSDLGGKLRLLETPAEPPAASAGAAPEPGTAFPAPEFRVVPQPAMPAAPPLPVREAFLQARLRFLQDQPPVYRPEVLGSLLQGVGERFPSIQLALPAEQDGPMEERIIEWTLFGRRIGFSVAPLSASEAWRRIAARWRERTSDGRASKLIGFAVAGPGAGVGPDAGRDVVELSADLLASLYAAEELLSRTPDCGAADAAEVVAFLAGELDYFWSRLTRFPLGQDAAVPLALASFA